jgi:hypothetical protein
MPVREFISFLGNHDVMSYFATADHIIFIVWSLWPFVKEND